ncbi:MAG: hypothetical protein QXJ14_01385 [Candidatus Aenigmatarchaeota archaeon]
MSNYEEYLELKRKNIPYERERLKRWFYAGAINFINSSQYTSFYLTNINKVIEYPFLTLLLTGSLSSSVLWAYFTDFVRKNKSRIEYTTDYNRNFLHELEKINFDIKRTNIHKATSVSSFISSIGTSLYSYFLITNMSLDLFLSIYVIPGFFYSLLDSGFWVYNYFKCNSEIKKFKEKGKNINIKNFFNVVFEEYKEHNYLSMMYKRTKRWIFRFFLNLISSLASAMYGSYLVLFNSAIFENTLLYLFFIPSIVSSIIFSLFWYKNLKWFISDLKRFKNT